MRALALIVVGCLIARADTIELKTGEKIEGTFKQAGSAGAVIEIGGQPVTFALGKVRAIYFGPAPQPASVSDAKAAIDALSGIRSIVKASVAYTEYSRRVLDAKVQADRFSNSNQGTSQLRHEVKTAMDFYNLAARAWNLKLFPGDDHGLLAGVSLARDAKVAATFANCKPVQARISFVTASSNLPADDLTTLMYIGKDFGDRMDVLWDCAATHLTAAESLTK